MRSTKPVWYAAYTRSKAEKKVASELTKLGIEHYLPLRTTIRKWSDRKKKVELPLINSYIFVHVRSKDYLTVLQVQGVVRIIHFDGKPVPVPDWQIENLKILLGTSVPVTKNYRNYKKGEEVRITEGSLTGLRGKIRHLKGKHKLVININALNYNLTIDIDPAFVEPIQASEIT